jgi:hypothetical protein
MLQADSFHLTFKYILPDLTTFYLNKSVRFDISINPQQYKLLCSTYHNYPFSPLFTGMDPA